MSSKRYPDEFKIEAVKLVVELAVEKGAQAVLMPIGCRKQLLDLSDDMATKVDIQFYSDARDGLLKALVE